jgi:DNA-binding transcriptional ArsR family regulator
VIEGGRLKRFFDRRLIKAIGHPLREHLLAVFNDRVASPTEIGRDIGLEVPAFYSHVKVLEELGCIEQVETKRRRGVKEHFFRAKRAVFFDDRAWQKVPGSVRSDITTSDLQSLIDEVVGALQVGTFAEDDETHLTWIPEVFDQLGWSEAMAAMDVMLACVALARRRSAARIAATGAPGFPATVAVMGFGTGPGPRVVR